MPEILDPSVLDAKYLVANRENYLRLTGRDPKLIDLVERYCKEQGLWRNKRMEPMFTEVLELDLKTVMPSVAGPRRPQDRIELRGVKQTFRSTLVDVFKKEVGESRHAAARSLGGEGPVIRPAITQSGKKFADSMSERLRHGASEG